jgi:hypothetical protein
MAPGAFDFAEGEHNLQCFNSKKQIGAFYFRPGKSTAQEHGCLRAFGASDAHCLRAFGRPGSEGRNPLIKSLGMSVVHVVW